VKERSTSKIELFLPTFAERLDELGVMDGFFNASEFLVLWGTPIRYLDFFYGAPSYPMS
jgi:hypothetical protein